MPKKVASIDAVFSIDKRGTLIALPKEDQWTIDLKERIFWRERIQIRTPAGECLSTYIKDIEMVNRGAERGSLCFTLPRSITSQDIPEGSELWLERDGIEPLLEP